MTKHPENGLIRWLANKVLSEITEDGGASFLELWHNQSGEEGERISRAQIPDEADAEEIAGEILELAQRDAQTRMSGLPERYNVRYFLGDNQQHEGYYPFLIVSENASRFTGDPTDPPTEKGLVGQLMRHLEASQRMMAQVVEVTTGRLIRDLETERQARAVLEKERVATVELREYLLDRKLERDKEQAAAVVALGHREKVMQTAVQMLPVVLSNLMPKGLPAAKASEVAISQFINGLSAQEVSGIMSSLEPKNQIVLSQVIASFQSKGANSEQKE